MQIENGVFNLFELNTQVYTCTYTQVNVSVCAVLFQFKRISPIRDFPEVNLLMSHPVLSIVTHTYIHTDARTRTTCVLLTVMATGMSSVILGGISFHYCNNVICLTLWDYKTI